METLQSKTIFSFRAIWSN